MKLKSTGLKFKNLGNPPTTIQTPDNHISLPTQVLAVGSVGRGKTFWITNLLRQLKESKCMDRIFFISSTVSSNLKLLQDLDIKEHDIYDPEDPDCIANVYQKNMAPKKPKVKKPKVEKSKVKKRVSLRIGEKAQKIIRYQIVSRYFLHGAFKVLSSIFCERARYFWFAALLFFVEPYQIFFRINKLTIQARTTLQNKYSYLNAVKRSINTSSTPLIILINESRLRLHS